MKQILLKSTIKNIQLTELSLKNHPEAKKSLPAYNNPFVIRRVTTSLKEVISSKTADMEEKARAYADLIKLELIANLGLDFVVSNLNRQLRDYPEKEINLRDLLMEVNSMRAFSGGNTGSVELPDYITNQKDKLPALPKVKLEDDQTYNLSDWMLKTLKQIGTSKQVKYLKESQGEARSWAAFYLLFDNQAVWDAKEYLSPSRSTNGQNRYEIGGYRFNSDVPGNLLYGYAGTLGGFSEKSLLVGAGYAQVNGRYIKSNPLDSIESIPSRKLGTDWQGIGDRSSNYDTPDDQASTKAGIELARRCGTQCTNSDLKVVMEDLYYEIKQINQGYPNNKWQGETLDQRLSKINE